MPAARNPGRDRSSADPPARTQLARRGERRRTEADRRVTISTEPAVLGTEATMVALQRISLE